MTRLIRTIALAGLLLGAVAASAVAAVGLGEATKFTAQFSTKHTGASTGLVLLTKGDPPGPGITEAPFVRQTVSLPQGTTVRLSAFPQCNASVTALAAEGAEGACPARSRIGTGWADSVYSGLLVHFDIGIYAVRAKIIEDDRVVSTHDGVASFGIGYEFLFTLAVGGELHQPQIEFRNAVLGALLFAIKFLHRDVKTMQGSAGARFRVAQGRQGG